MQSQNVAFVVVCWKCLGLLLFVLFMVLNDSRHFSTSAAVFLNVYKVFPVGYFILLKMAALGFRSLGKKCTNTLKKRWSSAHNFTKIVWGVKDIFVWIKRFDKRGCEVCRDLGTCVSSVSVLFFYVWKYNINILTELLLFHKTGKET